MYRLCSLVRIISLIEFRRGLKYTYRLMLHPSSNSMPVPHYWIALPEKSDGDELALYCP